MARERTYRVIIVNDRQRTGEVLAGPPTGPGLSHRQAVTVLSKFPPVKRPHVRLLIEEANVPRTVMFRTDQRADGESLSDKSDHPTVIEYAVRTMFKRKGGPRMAAKDTAKRLSGGENMFLGPGIVTINVDRLEENLWQQILKRLRYAISNVRPGKEHVAILGVADEYKLSAAQAEELQRRYLQR